MKKYWFSFAIIALLVGIVAFTAGKDFLQAPKVDEAGASKSNASVGISKGDLAPDFELKTLTGETVKLSDYRGKKVIINFWASWCPPCKAEMPHMEEFYKKNKENEFTILAVNLTNMDQGMENVQAFVDDYQLTFPILLDEEGKIGTQYEAHAIPTSYILDQQGVIRFKITGPMSDVMMEDMVAEIK